MPAITPPTTTSWGIAERGVRDGSSPVENFEVNSSGCERTFFVDWDYRDEFVKYMLGYAIVWDDSGTKRLSRLLPQKHPLYTDLVATKVTKIKGHKFTGHAVNSGSPYAWADNQINVFRKAEISVKYEHANYYRVEDATIYASGSEADRYVSVGEFRPSAEYLQLPGGTMKYIRSSGTANPHQVPIPFNIGKVLPLEEFTLTWHRLPEEVWSPTGGLYKLVYGDPAGSTPTPLIGRINNATFYGRPKGTLLFSGLRPTLNRSPLGIGWEWDIEYTFTYDPNGWNNKYYYPITAGTSSDAGWYFVGKGSTHYTADTVPDDYSIYNKGDFSKLFSVNN